MSADALRSAVSQLTRSANALAALALALDARVNGTEMPDEIAPYVDEVLGALGLRAQLEVLRPEELRPLLGELRTSALGSAALLSGKSQHVAWEPQQALLLQSAGDVSISFARTLKGVIAPQLAGLSERLEAATARFLDVGVGVAALSVEMARLWPALHIVGLDVWEPALALARANVRESGLTTRIELRQSAGEELDELESFDLAWLPSIFIAERVMPAIVKQVHRALRSGGWLLFPCTKASGDALSDAVARFRTASFGGLVWSLERIHGLLREQGFVDVRTLPSSPTSLACVVVARKA